MAQPSPGEASTLWSNSGFQEGLQVRGILTHGEQRLIDQFQRDLDAIERAWPMRGAFERIEPYILDVTEAGIRFRFIVYHDETHSWYGERRPVEDLQQVAELGFPRVGDVVFDLGANAGFMATWYALRVGEKGFVHAFDPAPWCALSCRYQAQLNHITNLRSYAVGVGAQRKKVKVPLISTQTRETRVEGQEWREFEVHPIMDYAHFRPDFIKMDIEGAETEIAPLLKHLPTLQGLYLELHPAMIRQFGGDPIAVLQAIQDTGLEILANNAFGAPLSREALHDTAYRYLCATPEHIQARQKTRSQPGWNYLLEYSRYYAERGEIERALEYARRGVELYPYKIDLHHALSDLLVRSGELLAAVDAASQAVATVPGDSHLTFRLSWLLGEVGRISEAVSWARKAISLDRSVAAFWHHLSFQLNKLNQIEEALTAIDEALRLDPTNSLFKEERARIVGHAPDNTETTAKLA